ncbi:hypothetical protein DXG01_002729 [Tephrocybe rancida]|nr:hypothetical protein DXG01_002729 [Tephrocybe rancida]
MAYLNGANMQNYRRQAANTRDQSGGSTLQPQHPSSQWTRHRNSSRNSETDVEQDESMTGTYPYDSSSPGGHAGNRPRGRALARVCKPPKLLSSTDTTHQGPRRAIDQRSAGKHEYYASGRPRSYWTSRSRSPPQSSASSGEDNSPWEEEDATYTYNSRRGQRASEDMSWDDPNTTRYTAYRQPNRQARDRSDSRIRELERRLKETQEVLITTTRRKDVLSDSLRLTQTELSRVYEERDTYYNVILDLRDELTEMEEQLQEVESRNYTLAEDYEALERDNVYLRQSSSLNCTFSQKVSDIVLLGDVTTYTQVISKDRRDLHHIRRRILGDKTVEALKRQYSRTYPMDSNESFYSWSKRVRYPGWERIAPMVVDAKFHGNKSAHRATQAQMLQTVVFALDDDRESGNTNEGEILQDMFDIVYSGGVESFDDVDSE